MTADEGAEKVEEVNPTDTDTIERLLRQGWRIRCPKGHSDLRDKHGPSVYCQSCGEAYAYGDLVDAREASTPLLISPADGRNG